MQKQNPVIKNYIWNPNPFIIGEKFRSKNDISILLEFCNIKDSECKIRF